MVAGEGRVGIAGAMVPSRGAALPIPAAPALSLAEEDRDKGGNEVRGEGPCPREVGGVQGSAGHGPAPEGPSTQGSAARSGARRVGSRKPPLGDGRGLHVLGGTRRSRWAESRPGPVGVWPHAPSPSGHAPVLPGRARISLAVGGLRGRPSSPHPRPNPRRPSARFGDGGYNLATPCQGRPAARRQHAIRAREATAATGTAEPGQKGPFA